jgi:thiol-disulfide isomerase/thioredoxin
MNKTATALVSIALALALAAAAAAQINEEQTQAPEIGAAAWINSPPLTLAGLRGKVVLIDFWDYTCINCIRTLPYLRLWHHLYAPLGLVIIGVHTPEFTFAKSPQRVAAAVKRLGLEYPVAMDNDRRIWRAFHNEGWPCEYLIDKDGRLEYSHCGEGDYAAFERLIQQLLKQADPRLDFSAARFAPRPDLSRSGAMCREPTPEIYLGFLRADALAGSESYQQLAANTYRPVAGLALDRFDLLGQWFAMPENIKNGDASAGGYDRLRLHYRAKSVYLVGGTDDGSAIAVVVTQDGKPVGANSRGVDLKTQAGGQTVLPITQKRIYYVLDNHSFGEHVLALEPVKRGVSFYSFTFGGSCEPPFDHR